MVEVEDPIVAARSVPFKPDPDEVYFLNFVVSDFTPILPDPEVYVYQEFDARLAGDC